MPTGQSDINRALTHPWQQLAGGAMFCPVCKMLLSEDTLVENVPPCSGIEGKYL